MLNLNRIAAFGATFAVLTFPMDGQAQGRASKPNPFDQFDSAPSVEEELGPEPHTLIVWSGNGQPVTISFSSGRSCQRAKSSIAAQTRPQRLANGGAIITAVTAICVPNG